MTETQVNCFVAAARTGSFASAAKELYLTIQSISTNIQNLEKEFSITLFTRHPGGVALTDEGRHFYRFALAWMEAYDSCLKAIETLYQNMALKFSIAFSEWIDPLGELFDAVYAFTETHSSTDVSAIHCSNRMILEKLERMELDAAIMCDTQVVASMDLDLVSFAREQLCLYFPPSVDGDNPAELSQALPHIDAPYGAWSKEEQPELIQRMCDNLGIPMSRRYTMPNFYSVVACAETVPCFVVSDARFGHLCRNTELRNIPLQKMSSLCCVWNKKNENPLLPQFISHIQAYFKSGEGEGTTRTP